MVRVAHHDTRIPEHAVFGILAMCLLAATAPADEAVRRDGSRTNGELVFTDSKKFDFKGIPFAELEIVRFKPKASSTPHTPLWHQVWLARGEVMFAEVRRLDANQLHVRPSWSGDVIAIPRTAIERITHRPGWQPVLFDSFERDLSLWKTNGEPRIDNGKLILDKPGQSIAATVDSQWNAGQIVVGAEFSQTKSRLVHLELVFLRNGKDSRIQIELAGPDKRFKLSSDRKPKLEQAIARASQSALVVEFNLDRLDVAVDDKVLWVEDESPGTLKSVRLVSSGDGGEASSVNDILVARQVEERTASVGRLDGRCDSLAGRR
jgi:hypothetical protein